MYYRTDMTHRVDWTPNHQAEARQAMEEVVQGFDSTTEPPVEVGPETAEAVQARYRELVEANPDITLGG
jgi:hypothetical protein